MGVSGYPTVPNYLPQTLFFKGFLVGFQGISQLGHIDSLSSLCENLNKIKKNPTYRLCFKISCNLKHTFFGGFRDRSLFKCQWGRLKGRGVI